MSRILTVLGLAVVGIGLLLHIVGLATTEWSYSFVSYMSSRYKQTFGLWKTCVDSSCTEYGKKTAKLEACNALAIIGMLLGIAGLGVGLVHILLGLCGKPQKKLFLSIAAASSNVASVTILICAIIWGGGIHEPSFLTLGYSFALSIVGGILIAIGGGILFLAYRQSTN